MITTIHCYNYDLQIETHRTEYREMCNRLKSWGLKVLRTFGDKSYYHKELDGNKIELCTKHVFNNQWNTIGLDGLRVFDWAEDYIISTAASWLRQGHYLEQTDEMRAIRHSTVACGYCGYQQQFDVDKVWCDQCLDDGYLKEDDLFLLRLRRIDDLINRPRLTDIEATKLKKRFIHAQLYGLTERGRNRIAANYARVEDEYKIAVENAENKKAAALWVLNNFPNLYQNWIYYDHTGKSCFGWRKPLSGDEYVRLSSIIHDTFPGKFEIKVKL